MKRIQRVGAALTATSLMAGPRLALAAGDSGTSGMGEMQIGAGTLLLFVAALGVMGVVIWLLSKFLSK